jgi:thiamine transport system ATP-binding protein
LLDEPLSALDRSLRERLATDLRHVLTETRTTAMMVTHDHGDAFTVADRTAIMRAGRLVQEGATAEVWAHPVDADTAHFLGVSVPSDLAEP